MSQHLSQQQKPEAAPEQKAKKKEYQKPTIQSEAVLEAGLGPACNGQPAGQRKETGACSKTFS